MLKLLVDCFKFFDIFFTRWTFDESFSFLEQFLSLLQPFLSLLYFSKNKTFTIISLVILGCVGFDILT